MRPDRALAHLEDVETYCQRAASVFTEYPVAVLSDGNHARAALERYLITIGEALVRLRLDAPELLDRLPGAFAAIAMRNVLVHQYHRILPEALERAVREAVPALEAAATSLIDEVRHGVDDGR